VRLELYYVGECVFATNTDVLPGLGCALVFPVTAAVLDLEPGELATAMVDASQPPFEFDFSTAGQVVTRLTVRDLARLVPE
jgi:hypothetical protein